MVQIPRLNRIQTTNDLPKNTRIQGSAPDTTELIQQRVSGLNQIAGDVADIYQKYENDEITNKSHEQTRNFKNWQLHKLNNLKKNEGNPADAYRLYEEEESKYIDELNQQLKDSPERVRRNVASALTRTVQDRKIHVEMQRNAQIESYQHANHVAALKTSVDDLADNAGLINVKDKSSTFYFDRNLNSIGELIAKRDLSKGLGKEVEGPGKGVVSFLGSDDEMTHVKLSNMALREQAENVSKGVKTSIDVLMSNGRLEDARYMKERYSNWLTPQDEVKINNSLKVGDTKNEASKFYQGIQYKDDKDQRAAIEKISDPLKRIEVQKLRESDKAFRDKEKKRQQDMNNEVLVKHVLNKDWNGIAELEADETYQMIANNLSASQLKSVRKLVQPSTTSDPKVLLRANTILLDRDKVASMTVEQFASELGGASSTHINQYLNEFRKRKEGGSEAFVLGNRADKILETTLYAEGLIEKNKYNKLDQTNTQRLAQSKRDLIEFLSHKGLDKSTTPAEIQQYVDEYVESAKVQKLFGKTKGGFWSNLFSDEEPTEVVPKAGNSNPLEGKSNAEITRLQLEYKRKADLSSPPNRDDLNFLNYVREKND